MFFLFGVLNVIVEFYMTVVSGCFLCMFSVIVEFCVTSGSLVFSAFCMFIVFNVIVEFI